MIKPYQTSGDANGRMGGVIGGLKLFGGRRKSGNVPLTIHLAGVPRALARSVLPEVADEAGLMHRPDVAVLTWRNGAEMLSERMSASMASVIPVVDATRSPSEALAAGRADLGVGMPTPNRLAYAVARLVPDVARLRMLHARVLESDDPKMLLMARLFVRGRFVKTRRKERGGDFAVDEAAVRSARHVAEGLVGMGMLTRAGWTESGVDRGYLLTDAGRSVVVGAGELPAGRRRGEAVAEPPDAARVPATRRELEDALAEAHWNN